jgi:urea transporter
MFFTNNRYSRLSFLVAIVGTASYIYIGRLVGSIVGIISGRYRVM